MNYFYETVQRSCDNENVTIAVTLTSKVIIIDYESISSWFYSIIEHSVQELFSYIDIIIRKAFKELRLLMYVKKYWVLCSSTKCFKHKNIHYG